MAGEVLIPINGCCVLRRESKSPWGVVKDHRVIGPKFEILVDWASKGAEWIALSELKCGFQRDWVVQDLPLSTTRVSLGLGTVVGRRELGGREQLLVQLHENGRSFWLPYEYLRRIKDVKIRFQQFEVGHDDHAERFRLKLLAHALENWNFLTGSLDRLDVDPLPHQIQLVHRIISSGTLNWLIADDVGLGKTIEVGLLLAALGRKGHARQVLVVCPAGLTRQWQDELQYKFDQHYEIYGRDFYVNKTAHWKLHDRVIVSIDLAKRDEHLEIFRGAGGWDIVVFDEGHELTRHASGERAQRYKLAEVLRPLASGFILLSGTPHQGYADRFIALLELIRPDLRSRIHTLELDPKVVSQIILRNRKSEVTDVEGNFIFKGQQVHRIPIDPSSESLAFHRLLRDYLIRGYKAGAAGGSAGRAIGFVMTTYRKLASSSIAAIEKALELRRERISGQAALEGRSDDENEISVEDLAEGGDEQDDLVRVSVSAIRDQFFVAELELIDKLLSVAKTVRIHDEKLRVFLDEVVTPVSTQNKKLLIFTEYRATQAYLKAAVEDGNFDENEVLLINGSMDLDEKLKTIELFNKGPNRFLISTEAGGEGLNLHRACNVMVNYDLPWNPARLVQRIGRLYRYGQKEVVTVFNLHARDSFDNAAIDLMMLRVAQIVKDMVPVGKDYNDRLYADILGDILDIIDLSNILQSTTTMEIERTRDEVDAAVKRAREAKELQDEIFSYVKGYDSEALEGTLGFTMKHVNEFIRGMLPQIDGSIDESLHGGRLLQIRLPESERGRFAEFGQRTVVRVTTDRRIASQFADVTLLDFESEFFRGLISKATSHEFNGNYASIFLPTGGDGVLCGFRLRWQNDQGDPLTENFLSVFEATDGIIDSKPEFLA